MSLKNAVFVPPHHEHVSRLMGELYGHPVVDIKWATSTLNTATNTAASLINDFITHGVLVEITGQKRNRLFIFKEYIDIFKA